MHFSVFNSGRLPHVSHVTMRDTRGRSSSPGSVTREAGLSGHPLLRSSHSDLHHLHRANTRHKGHVAWVIGSFQMSLYQIPII